jgi:hypothetical protein
MATMSRIRVLSLAKLQAAVMTFVGLIAGIAYSIGGAILDALSGSLYNVASRWFGGVEIYVER